MNNLSSFSSLWSPSSLTGTPQGSAALPGSRSILSSLTAATGYAWSSLCSNATALGRRVGSASLRVLRRWETIQQARAEIRVERLMRDMARFDPRIEQEYRAALDRARSAVEASSSRLA